MNKKLVVFTIFSIFGLMSMALGFYTIGKYIVAYLLKIDFSWGVLDYLLFTIGFIFFVRMYKKFLEEIKEKRDDTYKWLYGVEEDEQNRIEI